MERIRLVKINGNHKGYFLGPKLFGYQGVLPQSIDLQIRDIASAHLQRLVNEVGLTGHLAVREGNEAVYIDKKEHPGYIRINSWTGQHVPGYCTAVGKSLLLLLDPGQVEKCFSEGRLARLTDRTIVSVEELLKHLRRYRALGYTVDDRESEREGVCGRADHRQ